MFYRIYFYYIGDPNKTDTVFLSEGSFMSVIHKESKNVNSRNQLDRIQEMNPIEEDERDAVADSKVDTKRDGSRKSDGKMGDRRDVWDWSVLCVFIDLRYWIFECDEFLHNFIL